MRKHKYKNGKKTYYIHWKRSNGYTIGGNIEVCTIVSRYINTPVEPWYYINMNGKVITMGENDLYGTERKAKEEIKARIEKGLEHFETTYNTTKAELTNGLKNITDELL